jgi:hypothetical protein
MGRTTFFHIFTGHVDSLKCKRYITHAKHFSRLFKADLFNDKIFFEHLNQLNETHLDQPAS